MSCKMLECLILNYLIINLLTYRNLCLTHVHMKCWTEKVFSCSLVSLILCWLVLSLSLSDCFCHVLGYEKRFIIYRTCCTQKSSYLDQVPACTTQPWAAVLWLKRPAAWWCPWQVAHQLGPVNWLGHWVWAGHSTHSSVAQFSLFLSGSK